MLNKRENERERMRERSFNGNQNIVPEKLSIYNKKKIKYERAQPHNERAQKNASIERIACVCVCVHFPQLNTIPRHA